MDYIKIVIVNLIVFFVLLLSIEGLFRINELVRKKDKYWTHQEFRLTRPEPYSRSSYFSEKFINESFFQPNGWLTPKGTNLIIPNNYEGVFFHVKNNIRHTSFHVKNPKRNVYLFGGSTVYCSEVPDEFTIASQLQKMLNEGNYLINVFNYGVTSVHSGQELERLRRDLKIKYGDMVFFYDGVNDVFLRIVCKNSGADITNVVQRAPLFIRTIRRLKNHSTFFRWLDFEYLTKKDYDLRFRLIRGAAEQFRANIAEAEKIVSSSGGVFRHFLQPNLFSKKYFNEYEIKLNELKGDMVSPGMSDVFKATYLEFRNQFQHVGYSKDISSVFDLLEKSPYLDFCHVTEVANGVVAKVLFDEIQIIVGRGVSSD